MRHFLSPMKTAGNGTLRNSRQSPQKNDRPPAVFLRGQAGVTFVTGLYILKTLPSGVKYYERGSGPQHERYSKYLSFAGGYWRLQESLEDGTSVFLRIEPLLESD